MDVPNHFVVAVLVPADTTVDSLGERVASVMQAYLDVTCAYWSPGMYAAGAWSDYDPTADPANRTTCTICGGTGRRNDALGQAARAADPAHTCNGCAGPGVAFSHRPTATRPAGTVLTPPSDWAAHPGDIVAIRRILAAGWRFRPGAAPYALAVPNGWNWLRQQPDGCLDPLMRRVLRGWHSSAPDRWAVAAINARAVGEFLYTLPDGGQTLNPPD
jgi:hypothetical protein